MYFPDKIANPLEAGIVQLSCFKLSSFPLLLTVNHFSVNLLKTLAFQNEPHSCTNPKSLAASVGYLLCPRLKKKNILHNILGLGELAVCPLWAFRCLGANGCNTFK